MEFAFQILVNGIFLSAFYGMVAVGLSLVVGIMRIFNFAHGELYMAGAYGVWLFYGEAGWPFFAAVIVSFLITGAMGIAMERGIFRSLRGNPIAGFIASVGIMFILQVTVGQIWGVGLSRPVPSAFPEPIEFYGVYLSEQRLMVIPISLALLGGLWFFLQRVKTGQALRACAQDPEMAAYMGISINKMSAIALGLGSAFAGVAGALMAPLVSVTPYMGSSIIIKTFVIVLVGGAGRIEGAIAAAILFGFLDSTITTMADSTIANVVGLLIMFVILAFRPRGLLGREA